MSAKRRLGWNIAAAAGFLLIVAVATSLAVLWARERGPWFVSESAIETPTLSSEAEAPSAPDVATENAGIPDTVKAQGGGAIATNAAEVLKRLGGASDIVVVEPVPAPAIDETPPATDETATSARQDGPPLPNEKPDQG